MKKIILKFLTKIYEAFSEKACVYMQKEYLKYKLDHSDITTFIESHPLEDEEYILKFNNYQALVSMYMSPNTKNRRILLKWVPGVGKTIGVLGIAKRYIDIFKQTPDVENTIFVIGFTQELFKRELLRFPAFGYATRDEIKQLQYYEKNFDDVKYNELFIKLSRRLTSRKDGGYFQFIGYKAFVTKIFDLELSKIDIDKLSEEEFRAAVSSGTLQFNKILLSKFKNSLLICDEIHNVWNAQEKNNWGIAIQLLLDTEPTIKAVFLSATPISNSPTEIIDMMNLLLEPKEKISRQDLFNNAGAITESGIKILKKACQGKISYVNDYNPDLYAKQILMGKAIEGIPFLKFIRCPMSSMHYNTYKQKYNGTLTHDSQYLMDAVFPTPETKKNGYTGVFTSESIKKTYNLADEKWKAEVGLRFEQGTITGPGLEMSSLKMISGKFYEMIKNIHRLIPLGGNIGVYHSIVHITGVLFIEQIFQYNGIISVDQAPTADTLCNICGKKKSEHNDVANNVANGGSVLSNADSKEAKIALPPIQMYGRIVHIKEFTSSDAVDAVLMKYAYLEAATINIDVNDEKTIKLLTAKGFKISDKNEYFAFMQKTLQETSPTHGGSETSGHSFIPVRYIMVHGDMDKTQMVHALAKFNAPENLDGKNIRIQLGSRIMKEGYNVNNVQHVMIMSRPDSMPRLIQILGRYRRKHGHDLLPIERRVNNIYIYTSCLPGGGISYEEERYKEKAIMYCEIRKIEKTLNESAFDTQITGTNTEPQQNELFAPLPYTTPKYNSMKFSSTTFDVYYRNEEIATIIYIIKRLVMDVSIVWTYDSLFKSVKNPPFKMNENTTIISEENFILALYFLLTADDYNILTGKQSAVDILYSNTDKRLVLRNGQINNLRQIGEYIVFTGPTINQELVLRTATKSRNSSIDIYEYSKKFARQSNYSSLLVQFKTKYSHASFEELMIIAPKYGGSMFHEKLVEDCISYIVGVYTDPSQKKSEFHELFNKMLSYYNAVGLIMWASTAPEYVQEQYRQYILPFKSKVVGRQTSTQSSSPHLTYNIEKTREIFAQTLISTTKALEANRKKTSTKVSGDLLPVGHFMKSATPMIYDPVEKKWNKDTKYMRRGTEYKENDIIIGYHEKAKDSLEIKFKIRSPYHLLSKSSDARKNKKGSTCTTNQKWRLLDLLTKLGKTKDLSESNLSSLCDLLETTLINKEIEAATMKTGIKWFYFFWEDRELKAPHVSST